MVCVVQSRSLHDRQAGQSKARKTVAKGRRGKVTEGEDPNVERGGAVEGDA